MGDHSVDNEVAAASLSADPCASATASRGGNAFGAKGAGTEL